MDEYVCPRCGTPARGASACAGCGAELDALSELPRAGEYAAGGIAVLVAEHEAEAEAAAGAPASVLVRWIALVFDTVLGIFAALLGALAFALVGKDAQAGAEVAVLLWFVAYPAMMIAFANGQTLGKRALRIRAERDDGEAIGLVRAIVRESILKLVFTLIPFGLVVDALVAQSDERRRSIHDRAAGTRVVTAAPHFPTRR